MKKFLQTLMLVAVMAIPFASNAQSSQTITIGTGTSTNYHTPFCNYYYNGSSEMIYTASEIGTAGLIDTLRFHIGASATVAYSNLHIYMAHTSASTISAGWVALSDMQLVYSDYAGSLSGSGWQTYVLSDPFYYDGVSNLVILCTRQGSSYSSSLKYTYTETPNGAAYLESDSQTDYGIFDRIGSYSPTVTNQRPNIQLTIDPTAPLPCMRVANVATSSLDVSSATITWTETGMAASWDFVFSDTAVAVASLDAMATTVSSTSYDLSNLDANTQYYVYVRANCGSQTSGWSNFTFRTPCEAVSDLPYAENFESYTSGSLNPISPCWVKGVYGSSTQYPYPSSTAASNGNMGLYFYGYLPSSASTTPNYSWAALPLFEEDLDQLMVSFNMKRYSSTGAYYTSEIYVGVMSNPYDISTFDTVAFIDLFGEPANSVHRIEVSLADYQGEGGYIALFAGVPALHGSTYCYNYAYVDDLVVDYIPNCLSVTNIHTGHVGTTEAEIIWSERGTAYSWVIEYADSLFTPQNGEGTMVAASDTSFTLDNLDSATTYYIYVYADCGGDYSAAYDYITVRTLESSPATIPFFCDFEGEGNNGFTLVNGNQTTAWMVGTGTASTGTKSLYLSGNGSTYGYGTSSSKTYAYRDIEIEESGDYAVSYDWKCQGESGSRYYDYLRVFLAPGGTVINAGTFPLGVTGCYAWASQILPTGWIELSGYTAAPYSLTGQSSFVTNNVVTAIPAGTYRLYFAWTDDATYMPPAAVDNVSIVRLTCPQPTSLVATNITTNGFDLNWTPAGDETSWEVTVGNTVDIVSSSTYTVTGLASSTPYRVSVRAICGDEDTSYATTTSVNTACGEIDVLPWSQNFNSYQAEQFPLCWEGGGYSNYPYTTEYNGSMAMNMYTDNTNQVYLSLPAVQTSTYALNTLQVSFDAMKTYNYTSTSYTSDVIVGVCSVQGDLTTFVPVDTILNIPLATTPYDVSFANYSDTGRYITFVSVGLSSTASYVYNYLGLDNITVMQIPSCARPESIAVTRVWGDTVDLAWVDNSGSSWEVAYGVAGFDPDGESATIVSGIYEDTLQLTGLNMRVSYDFYVRTDCGGDYSPWRGPVSAIPAFFANVPATGSATVQGCGLVIYDNGGADGDYTDYNDGYLVIYPSSNDSLVRLYGSYNTETNYDKIYVYDGAGLGGTVLVDAISGAGFIDTLVSTTGPLTIRFTTDGSGLRAGFELIADCVPAPECGHVEDIQTVSTPYNAVVSWTPSIIGTYAGATVILTAANTVVDSVVVSGTSHVFSQLTPGTQYTVSVAAECEAGVSQAETATFVTGFPECGTMVPGTTDTIVTGTGTLTQSGVPVYSSWGNTVCQSIFTAAELHAMGLDSGAFVGIDYIWSSTPNYNKEFTVFMGTTTLSTFSSTSDMISVANHTQVYNGAHPNASGVEHINFDNSFNWDGVSNLVLTSFMNQSGSSQSSSGFYGYATATSDNVTVYRYKDSYPFTMDDMLSSGSGSAIAYRPSVTFYTGQCQELATCIAPAVVVSSYDVNSVSLVWAPGNEETSWNLYQKRAADNAYTFVATATTNEHTFTNLLSGTNYDFMVVPQCSDDSVAAVVRQATECAMISQLPFSENFNTWGVGSGIIPNCWSRAGSYSTYGYISGSYNHSGSTGGSYYMYATSGTNYYTNMILPELDTTAYAVNQLQVVFSAYNSSTYYNIDLAVGVTSDPNNPSSFVAVDTIHVNSLENWETYEVPLSNYNGNGTYVTIREVYVSGYGYGYVDDVTLEPIPTCPRPDSLMATNATANSVDLSWRERGSATDWIIEYGPEGFALGTGTQVAANSNPFTLTGLPAAYQGEFYVRSVCGAGDSSYYSFFPVAFSTSQVPATIPYSYDFESPAEWANWQTNSNCDVNWYVGALGAATGNAGAYVSADNGATRSTISGVANVAAYRDIDFGTTDSSFVLTFKAKAGGTFDGSIYHGLCVLLEDPSVPVVASNSGITSPWGNLNEINVLEIVANDTNWTTYQAMFDHVQGVKRVVLFWFNQSTNLIGGPGALDDISIEYQSCPRPTDVVVDEATLGSSTATLSWNGPANADYEVIYRPYPTGTSNTFATTNTNSITLTGLNSATQYAVWVRKICSAADTSETSDGYLFTTSCFDGAIDAFPWVEDFEGGIDCWNQDLTDAGSYQWTANDGSYTSSYAGSAHSGSSNAYFQASSYDGYTAYLITPMLNLGSATEAVKMTFYHAQPAWGNDQDTLGVYYRVHPDSAWHYLAGWNDDISDWQLDSVYLPNPSATYQVGFLGFADYGYGVVVDDITVFGPESACPAPAILTATADYETISMTWNGSASEYEVAIKLAADLNWGASTTVTTNNYTFTGLYPNTEYDVRVRALCGDDGNSGWTVRNSITTDDLPCFVPTNVTTSNATVNSITVAWTNDAQSSAQSWVVNVFNATTNIMDTVRTNPATINGLYDNTQYSVAVKAMCSAVFGSDWSDTVTFTTTTCSVVSNVSVSNITTSGATVTWTAGASETAWEVNYGRSGFGEGQGTIAAVTTTTYQITGLEEDEDYDVYVRAKCAEGIYSDWSPVRTFTTLKSDENGIDGVDGSYSLSIYPNPATSNTTISLRGIEGEVTITVVDMNGRTISSDVMNCGADCVKTMTVDGLAQGTYFVRVLGDGINSVRKLIVR